MPRASSPKASSVRHQVREDQAVEPQRGPRTLDVVDRPLALGDRLPAVCTLEDVARHVLRCALATAYTYQRRGDLKAYEILPRIGRARYCGAKLQRYIEGQPEPRVGVFGRRAG